MKTEKRFFGWTLTENWIETNEIYVTAYNHAEVSTQMILPNVRITNDRFREIEKTGKYYRITENKKGGKSFIFEVLPKV